MVPQGVVPPEQLPSVPLMVRPAGSWTVRTSGDDYGRYASINPVLDLTDPTGLALVPAPAQPPEPVAEPQPARSVNGPRIEVDDTQNALIIRDRPEAMIIVSAREVLPARSIAIVSSAFISSRHERASAFRSSEP